MFNIEVGNLPGDGFKIIDYRSDVLEDGLRLGFLTLKHLESKFLQCWRLCATRWIPYGARAVKAAV